MWKSFLLYVCCLLETLDIHHGMEESVVIQVGTVAGACLVGIYSVDGIIQYFANLVVVTDT